MSTSEALQHKQVRSALVLSVILLAVLLFAARTSLFGSPRAVFLLLRQPADTIDITAHQLDDDYDSDPVAADAEYQGHLLAISGLFSGLDQDFQNQSYLILRSPTDFVGIHARLAEGQTVRAQLLAKGTPIKLLCQGGGVLQGSPVLNQCVLE